MRRILVAVSLVLAAVTGLSAETPETEYVFPLIRDHGGVVDLPKAALPPRKDSKVVVDITTDERKGGVSKALDSAARIVNLYALAKAGPENGLELTIVLHGKATKMALSHEAYKKLEGASRNPDLELLQSLGEAGVDVFVCGQALAHNEYSPEDVAPGITIASSAVSVNVNRQLDGYAYLPFH